MQYEHGSRVPIIRDSEHPYMVDLYARRGVADRTDPQQVLDSAEAAWNGATDIAERIEATELLMGRRVDGREMNTLPFELAAAILSGDPFEVAYRGVARALEIGAA